MLDKLRSLPKAVKYVMLGVSAAGLAVSAVALTKAKAENSETK